MLNKFFDPNKAYRAVVYLRMSSDKQNPRSPDQQYAEIGRRLKALSHKWVIVATYRDDGISGRYARKRAAYQKMLRDLKSGAVAADLILVDTLERLGRLDDLQSIRKQLRERHGVLVLTADSNFLDPNTPQGRALSAMEAMRAVEDGRVKAHNVLRGKRDSAALKHWPGGAPPFGYMLRSVLKTVRGREEMDYCVLTPNPATRGIIELLFELAERTSHGATRLAKALNGNPGISDEYKPFHPATIGYWLDSPIYYGDFYWAKNATGIVDDTRVVEANATADITFVAEFCEPLIARERWENVQAVRRVRRDRALAARKTNSDAKKTNAQAGAKQIKPLAPGMTLNYLLSGLVFCECGLRMTASSTQAYTRKDGVERHYTSYVCPGYLAGACENNARIPEEWLRSMVIGLLCRRLFPESTNDRLSA